MSSPGSASTAAPPAAVEFRHVRHAYPTAQVTSVPVLDDLNFRVAMGEFVTLLGPSGCGKSTILRLIAGFESARTGDVVALANERAFVFQEAQLLPWRNALENVMLPLELKAAHKPDVRRQRAEDELNKLALGDALYKYPHQLSGGMKMRVSVARALVSDPQLLLLDEPFSALDDRARHQLQEDLRDLWQASGMTVVFVTHSIPEAVFLSDRILQLSPRPARLLRDLRIDLGRERKADLRFEPRFLELVRSLSHEEYREGALR